MLGKVMPALKARIDKLEHKDDPHADKHPVGPPPPPPLRPMLAAVVVDPGLGAAGEPLRTALAAALGPWAARRHHEAKPVDAAGAAPKAVAFANADLSIIYDVRAFDVERDTAGIPLAKAQVRVRIADASKVVFDRVVITDTIVGEKNLAADKLAERVAREVMQIVDPHVKRRISAWQ
jgi:hypothetical protein